jgi:hypothetical protein
VRREGRATQYDITTQRERMRNLHKPKITARKVQTQNKRNLEARRSLHASTPISRPRSCVCMRGGGGGGGGGEAGESKLDVPTALREGIRV